MSNPNKISFFYNDPKTEELAFQFNDDGTITCLNAHHIDSAFGVAPRWCPHLKDAMMKRWDAQAIWKHSPPDSMLRDQLHLEIPMFPTSDQYTSVYLIKDAKFWDEGFPRYLVQWDNPFWISASTQFVTFVNPGDGRMQIRDALWQKMQAEAVQLGYTECKASHHGFNAQLKWEDDMRDAGKEAAAKWSVYQTLWCLYCRSHSGSGDDLVPERERTGVW